ncbi:hypothetical protein VTK56DRAFT_7208 [Thermocarpiscus australiensis]
MTHNVLLTGVSGYLGGELLAQLASADLPPHGTIYALVRTDAQADSVRRYGVEPLIFDVWDAAAVEENVVKYKISVVFWLVDAFRTQAPAFIRALSRVKKETGLNVHFLHTSGAKIFSEHSGSPADQPLFDNDPNLYQIQSETKPPLPVLKGPVETNNIVIDTAEKHGVRAYIFVPCIVYGENSGFGNPISIQTTAIVKAAVAAGRVYKVDATHPTWPVCHNHDNAALYLSILQHILLDDDIPHGKNGHYLASSGSIAWDDLYEAMAKALFQRGVVEDETVVMADDPALEKMAEGLNCPKELVRLELGGKCTFTAINGFLLGWKPKYPAEHILQAADAEVERILRHVK